MSGFEELYRQYYPRVYAFLLRLTGNPTLCEELTQETFYQAFLSFDRFRGDCDIFTWLAAIAKNTWYRCLRHNRAGTVDVELSILPDPGSDAHPERTVQQKLLADQVRDAIEKLPPKQRDVMILRLFADLPFSQIAAMMHITETSAKVIFHRAKNQIREAYQDDYEL